MHNLRSIAWDTPTEGFDWARRFDDDLREVLPTAPGDLLRLAEHDDYRLAVPTPDHGRPPTEPVRPWFWADPYAPSAWRSAQMLWRPRRSPCAITARRRW